MREVDNIEIDLSPFKGPFKGKRRNREAVEMLNSSMADLQDVIKSEIDAFNKIIPRFRRPFKLALLTARGRPQLWWREARANGPWIKDIYNNPEFMSWLAGLLPETKNAILEFDDRRHSYNFQANILGTAKEHYAIFITNKAKGSQFRNHT